MTTNLTREFYAEEDYLPNQELEPMPELGEPGAESRERWRRIVIDGKSTDYEVSDYGRVINPRGRLLKPSRPKNFGTFWVSLSVDGARINMRIDKLVLRAYAKAPSNEDLVPVHGNGDLVDNRLENLGWGSLEVAKRQTVERVARKKKRRRPVKKAQLQVQEAPVVEKRQRKTRKTADEVEVTRTYRLHDMSVSVDLQGGAEVILGHDYELLPLTAAQVSTLATLLGRVVEMNVLMGGAG